jgi:hypothetical protein
VGLVPSAEPPSRLYAAKENAVDAIDALAKALTGDRWRFVGKPPRA